MLPTATTPMDRETRATAAWWGHFTVGVGESLHWRIGMLRLWICRFPEEWRAALAREVDLSNILSRTPSPVETTGASPALVAVKPTEDPPPSALVRRFAMTSTTEDLRLSPACADRAVVVGPRESLSLVPGHEVVMFVNSPLWFRVEVGAGRALLFEEAITRPSDTWLGPPGGEGELCYWSQTDTPHEAGELPVLPHRVFSRVRVINRAATPLALDRLRLPMPQLSLFSTPGGRLWTESLVVERAEDGEVAAVRLEDGPPAREARLVAEPRRRGERGFLARTFGGVLRVRGA